LLAFSLALRGHLLLALNFAAKKQQTKWPDKYHNHSAIRLEEARAREEAARNKVSNAKTSLLE